jgi:cell division protein FtsX
MGKMPNKKKVQKVIVLEPTEVIQLQGFENAILSNVNQIQGSVLKQKENTAKLQELIKKVPEMQAIVEENQQLSQTIATMNSLIKGESTKRQAVLKTLSEKYDFDMVGTDAFLDNETCEWKSRQAVVEIVEEVEIEHDDDLVDQIEENNASDEKDEG